MGRPIGNPICLKGHDKNAVGRVNRGCCRVCIRDYQRQQRREWRKQNPRAEKNGKWRRQGIVNPDNSSFTIVDYDRNYQIQKGLCKICGVHQSDSKQAFAVDHDHRTGFFRGLLCPPCNLLLGSAKDNKDILQNAKNYLMENH
jgi:hypothetical protein